jgi:DMSO/TMAO reductase YedYZ molybdopterin-dependent catalytic subunit
MRDSFTPEQQGIDAMTSTRNRFLQDHASVTRRFFLGFGAAGLAAMRTLPLHAAEPEWNDQLQQAVDKLESWLTSQDEFQDVSRGNPKPHSIDEETRNKVGLTRDTWKLDVISDPKNPAVLTRELSAEQGTAFDFQQLMQLAESKSVRFAKVMTCLNIGCPLGNGIWEGVPLRDVLWMTSPRKDLRRVFYYGYHNDKPEQMTKVRPCFVSCTTAVLRSPSQSSSMTIGSGDVSQSQTS